MPRGPVRRAQLIAPFGTGAMVVVRDWTSVISGGLDHWFELESGDIDSRTLDRDEYRVEEWRLQDLLKVDHFFLPPDYREKRRGETVLNCKLTIPFLRFPQWHFCPECYRLYHLTLSRRGRVKCEECLAKCKRTRYLVQVPFVVMCDQGHIQDFPWREWVHKSAQPACDKPLRLIATGGASLAAQKVICECEAERSLAQVTTASTDGNTTYLSENLDEGGQPFNCQGKRPWLGTEEGEPCDRPLRGSPRSASNVYYAEVWNAIYIPRGGDPAISELVAILEEPPFSTFIKTLAGAGAEVTPDDIRGLGRETLLSFPDVQVAAAISVVLAGQPQAASGSATILPGEDAQVAFRRAEFNVLLTPRNDEQLVVQEATAGDYAPDVAPYFSRVMLVHKLRETRALAGFTRVFAENQQTLDQRKALLWRQPPQGRDSWLPAHIVYGEGIFIQFDEERLQAWEDRPGVIERARRLQARYRQVQAERHLRDRSLDARFLLLHTFAHLFINTLTFECGYSSAALRERLYVSAERQALMAGVLIYTAAGDSEGTLGGLVRMAKPGYFEPTIRRALENARWCSADPVCMEMGERGGQGPDSCNLAACHNCALVPETACEEFNRFLDRALAVGDLANPQLGYFSGWGAA